MKDKDAQGLVKSVFKYLLLKKWRVGESINFEYGDWQLTIRREKNEYAPFLFAVEGQKPVNECGTTQTIGRRYYMLERALLHIMNNFNENAAIKDRYASMNDALDKIIN